MNRCDPGPQRAPQSGDVAVIGGSGFQVDMLAGRLLGCRLIGGGCFRCIASFLFPPALLLIAVLIANPQSVVIGFAGVFHLGDMMLELLFELLGMAGTGVGLLIARAGNLALLHRALADTACDARAD